MGTAPHSTVCRAIATIASQPQKAFAPRRIEQDVLARPLPNTGIKGLSPGEFRGQTARPLFFRKAIRFLLKAVDSNLQGFHCALSRYFQCRFCASRRRETEIVSHRLMLGAPA